MFVFWVRISFSSWLRHAFVGQDLNGAGGERTQRAFTQVGFASQLPCPSPCRGSFLYLIICGVYSCFFVFDLLCCLFACCVWSSVYSCADSQLEYNHRSSWQWQSYICLENGGWCLETRRKTGRSSFCYVCPCCFTTAAQDGVERDFWKYDGLLVCHDKSELNLDKIIVFNNKDKDMEKPLYFEKLPTDADSKKDDLRKGLKRCENFLP